MDNNLTMTIVDKMFRSFIIGNFFLGFASIFITAVTQYLYDLTEVQSFFMAGGVYIAMMAYFLTTEYKGAKNDETHG